MRRLLLSLALTLGSLTAAIPAQAAGTFVHATPAYSVQLAWGDANLNGIVISGTISANGRTANVRQTLRTGDVFTGLLRPLPIIVRRATETVAPSGKNLTLDLWSPAAEFTGSVTLTFTASHIVHRSEIHFSNGGFVPTVESVTRIDWNAPYQTTGSVKPDGAVVLDNGVSLDPYGDWQNHDRYGVFVSDAGGPLVGHARLVQGDQANYLSEGRFRTGAAFTEATTYFNGFLDYGTIGLAQPVWAVDALSFLSSGTTPADYAALLPNFPGFGPVVPPANDLQNDGQVVIAVADTGINPYHRDFRNPAMTAHPSTYITGFPAGAQALNLTFGSDYAASRNADDAGVWSQVQQGKLYWIPGTKIIGAYSIGNAPTSVLPADQPFPPRFVIDDDGHGTGTASVSTGYGHGTCEKCLLVVIEGTSAGVAWAASQPWIDIISNSYGPTASLPVGDSHVHSRSAYNAGKSVLYSSGNGMSGTGLAPDHNASFTRPTSGPSWVVSVGAASPRNDQEHTWYGVPADVISYGSNYPAAHGFHARAEQVFSGTSCATPITAGVEGALLAHARKVLGDAVEGTQGGVLASLGTGAAPGSGPLADGTLTRNDLEEVLHKTAIAPSFDPGDPIDLSTVPGTPATFLTAGYGLVNRSSLASGIAVLDGAAPMPSRPNEDAWKAQVDEIRDFFWGQP